ncbi:MAG TPA: helix-turn-helix transcriptional regulator [Solirubrobacterales bacterium]
MESAAEEEAARKAFAERLTAEIKRRKISHRRLAERIQTSTQSVTNWTQGRNEPNLRYLRRLAKVLDIPVARLFGEETRRGGESRAAEALVRDLANLELQPPVTALRDSAPALLDVLSRAEKQARRP